MWKEHRQAMKPSAIPLQGDTRYRMVRRMPQIVHYLRPEMEIPEVRPS
jgi:hypothetical protein